MVIPSRKGGWWERYSSPLPCCFQIWLSTWIYHLCILREVYPTHLLAGLQWPLLTLSLVSYQDIGLATKCLVLAPQMQAAPPVTWVCITIPTNTVINIVHTGFCDSVSVCGADFYRPQITRQGDSCSLGLSHLFNGAYFWVKEEEVAAWLGRKISAIFTVTLWVRSEGLCPCPGTQTNRESTLLLLV